MLTPAGGIELVAGAAVVLSLPTMLTLAARRLRSRRRRPSPFPRGTEVRFVKGVAEVPDRFAPFDWDDEDPAVVEGEIVRDHGHDTVLMRALELADRECDDTRIVPLQRGRGGVR